MSEPVAQGEVQLPADLAVFVEHLQDDDASHGGFLEGHGTTYVARAPGRLDVMGGIADYSGATVCELPLEEAAIVALRWREDDLVRVRTLHGVDGSPGEVSVALSDLVGEGAAPPYEEVRERLAASPDDAWAAYLLGAFTVLARERGVRLVRGADLLVESAVPPGKGVSSSAALEVATLRALTEATDTTLDGYSLALLGQALENRVVGAPCGLMDQLTSALGCAGELLRIRCQGRGTPEPLPVPEGVRFLGVDSGVRHAVRGASYGDVRVGAFMGYRIVADLLGLEARTLGPGRVEIDDPVHGGWLCNIPPSLFRARFLDRLPETMAGAEFLERYGGTTDPVTRVDPARTYPVRAAAAHPVEEEHRVRAFLELLSGSPTSTRLELAGELMLQAHTSYGRCGLGSDATDELVELAREAGTARGVYGAKITGGGSGGTVAFLAHGEGGERTVREIAVTFGRRHGFEPTVFAGSSPGAMRIPVLRVAM